MASGEGVAAAVNAEATDRIAATRKMVGRGGVQEGYMG
jgi:hypothetical protein